MVPKLSIISGGESNCAGGQCPTVYRSDDGRIFVQGWKISDDIRRATMSATNEDMVEVPASLLTNLKI